MKRELHELIQGTPEWHQFRANHDGASEVPAVLGLSKYTTRSELLRKKATGISPEVDAGTQSLFDAGHATEAAARPLAEEIIQEELYPATYSYGRLSASCDGLTMDGTTAFEHKLYRKDLAEAVMLRELPDEYMAQCQQIMLVTGASKVLFVTSDGTDANWAHMFVDSDLDWHDRIIDGWGQFHKDLATYQPVEVIPAAVAAPVMALPAVSIKVEGAVALISNLPEFGENLQTFIERIPKKPSTDQEFADCKAACKTLQEAQDALDAAEAHAMGQVSSFDEMRRAKAMLYELARTTRLAVEKLVSAREQAIKVEIVQKAKAAYEAHETALKEETGGPWIVLPAPDFAGAIKGKRTIASIQNAVDTALANGKIAADASAKRVRESLACIKADGEGYEFLFSDRLALIGKPIDDLKLLIKSRIGDHKAAKEKEEADLREKLRLEAEAKLRADEEAKARIEAEAKAKVEADMKAKADAEERQRREIEEASRKADIQRAADLAAKEAATRTEPIKVAAVGGSQPVDASKEPASGPSKDIESGQISAARPATLSLAPRKARPSDEQIILAVSEKFGVDRNQALTWIADMEIHTPQAA